MLDRGEVMGTEVRLDGAPIPDEEFTPVGPDHEVALRLSKLSTEPSGWPYLHSPPNSNCGIASPIRRPRPRRPPVAFETDQRTPKVWVQ